MVLKPLEEEAAVQNFQSHIETFNFNNEEMKFRFFLRKKIAKICFCKGREQI